MEYIYCLLFSFIPSIYLISPSCNAIFLFLPLSRHNLKINSPTPDHTSLSVLFISTVKLLISQFIQGPRCLVPCVVIFILAHTSSDLMFKMLFRLNEQMQVRLLAHSISFIPVANYDPK